MISANGLEDQPSTSSQDDTSQQNRVSPVERVCNTSPEALPPEVRVDEITLETNKEEKKASTLSQIQIQNNRTNQIEKPTSERRISVSQITERIERGLQSAYETVSHVWEGENLVIVSHDQLPDWLQDNADLQKWHRKPKASYTYCFKSILRWHTETGNIWTHMVAAFLCIGLIGYYISVPSSHFVAPFEEKHLITLFLLSAVLCLIFSTLMHTLTCHSPKIQHLFGRLDFSGIALLCMGSFIPWVYYTFYCSAQPRVIYLVTISILGTGAIIFSQWDRFAKPEYRVVRAAMFSSLGASGFIPMFHMIIERGLNSALKEGQLQWMILMFLCYGVGAVIYATRVPERFFPGKFDLVFQSHQIFHVLVIMGILLHLYSVTNLQFYRWQKGNKC